MHFDVKGKYSAIIIGSGISGLICALELSKANKNVLVLSKEAVTEGSSTYAQGGIAIPLDKSDSVEKHLEDTLEAGCFLNDESLSREIILYSNTAYEKLLSYGVKFDLDESNNPHLTKEAAHSFARVCHVGGDASGRHITKILIDKACRDQNISISQGTVVLSILKNKNGNACGVIVEDITKDKYILLSEHVIVATGGIGQIFEYTTNPRVSSGDGVVMAYKAGANLQDLEMIQFHPTVLIDKIHDPFLITEAIRGEGAKLKNINGEFFALKYHPAGELAPRDVLSRAIVQEMKNTNSDFVYLDLSNFDEKYFKERFPTVYDSCIQRKLDIFGKGIPVRPSAHYFIGGVKCDVNGRTCVKNLWVVGEAGSNGFHGANRLASNSLLECIVVPYFLVNALIKEEQMNALDYVLSDNFDKTNYSENKISDDLLNLKKNNSAILGLVRNGKDLENHLIYLNKMNEAYNIDKLSIDYKVQELKNMIYLSVLITKSALNRKESLGVHYREDYSDKPKKPMHTIFKPGEEFLWQETISTKNLVSFSK